MPYGNVPGLRSLDTDFDFILADRIIHSSEYLSYYHEDFPYSLRMLDNGMHEGGTPLVASTLLDMAAELGVDVIIGPDHKNDWEATLERTTMFRTYWKGLTAIVLHTASDCIDTPLNQLLYAHRCAIRADFNIICLPYRTRNKVALNAFPFAEGIWYHFLGLNNLAELEVMKNLSKTNSVSLDTGKPFRLGYEGIRMDAWESLPHKAPFPSGDVQWNATTLMDQQKELIAWNIAEVKKRLR